MSPFLSVNFRNSVFILSLSNHKSWRLATTRLTTKDFPHELIDYDDYYAHAMTSPQPSWLVENVKLV